MQTVKPELQVDVQAHAIDFIWSDFQARLSYQRLREICPCAYCRSKRLKGFALTAEENVYVTELNHQGYGIQICFSDGHDKGLFPWVYLRQVAEQDALSHQAQS